MILILIASLAWGAVPKVPTQDYKSLLSVALNESKSTSERWKAMIAAPQADKRAIADVKKALTHKEWLIRNAALISLQQVAPEQAQIAAVKLLKDDAMVVRSAAVDVLNVDMPISLREKLWQELDKKHNFRKKQSLWIREQIVDKLAVSPKADESAKFSRLLIEDDKGMQVSAIRGLETLHQKTFISANASLADKRSFWVEWSKQNKSIQ